KVLETDALSPTVRQLVFRDMPSVFNSTPPVSDRGRVLEEMWEKTSGGARGLGIKFAQLAAGERQGWRPSLIVTPTILEGGTRLVISNLNLEGISGGIEFFNLFPNSELKLSTALRMNAAFPFVSPAVNLPTNPPRRVIDAGFLDNYGVTTAADWITGHREW